MLSEMVRLHCTAWRNARWCPLSCFSSNCCIHLRGSTTRVAGDRGGGGRHDPDPPRRVGADRRDRGGARRADRRRGARGGVKPGGRSARPFTLAGSVRPYPDVRLDMWRMVAPHGVRAAALLAAAAGGHAVGDGAGVAGAAGGDAVRAGSGAAAGGGALRWPPPATCRPWPLPAIAPLGAVLPLVAVFYMAATVGSAVNHYPGAASPGRAAPTGKRRMSDAVRWPMSRAWSGKDRGDENFPVGSRLIARRCRPHVHAFYTFARNADDIANTPTLPAGDKVCSAGRHGGRCCSAGATGVAERARPARQPGRDSVTPVHAHGTADRLPARRDASVRYADLRELSDIAATLPRRSAAMC